MRPSQVSGMSGVEQTSTYTRVSQDRLWNVGLCRLNTSDKKNNVSYNGDRQVRGS